MSVLNVSVYYCTSNNKQPVLSNARCTQNVSCKLMTSEEAWRHLPSEIYCSYYSSVFQPGFRGTQRFRQLLTGFPENPQISTRFRQTLNNFGKVPRLKKVEKHCITES